MDYSELMGRFPGVTLNSEGGVFYMERRIGTLAPSGSGVVFRLEVHRLDYGPLLSEYPFLIPSPEGVVEILLEGTPGEDETAALLECLSSAVDRAADSSE